jgi:outer membrane protein
MWTLKTGALSLGLAIALAAPGAAPAQALPNAVIAIVDTDRIYRECTACRAAQTQLQAQVTQLQQRAEQAGRPLQVEAEAIEQAAAAARQQQGAARTAAEAALQTRISALRNRETTTNQELTSSQQRLQSIQANVLRQINARLDPIISETMIARGGNIALDTKASLARSVQLDITAEVLGKLNERLPSVSVTPLPAQ